MLHLPIQDAERLVAMHKAAKANPRYGYRRIAVISGLEFGSCWRLWKQHNFRLEVQRTRKRRNKDTQSSRPQQAEYPNYVWTYDILFDRLANGRQFKTLSILDEFTRGCQAILVATSILAQDVIALLATVIKRQGAPAFIRSDNGSEFTAQSVQAWLEQSTSTPLLFPLGNLGKTASSKASMISSEMNVCSANGFTHFWKPKW